MGSNLDVNAKEDCSLVRPTSVGIQAKLVKRAKWRSGLGIVQGRTAGRCEGYSRHHPGQESESRNSSRRPRNQHALRRSGEAGQKKVRTMIASEWSGTRRRHTFQGQVEAAKTIAGERIGTALQHYCPGLEMLHDLPDHLRGRYHISVMWRR